MKKEKEYRKQCCLRKLGEHEGSMRGYFSNIEGHGSLWKASKIFMSCQVCCPDPCEMNRDEKGIPFPVLLTWDSKELKYRC